MGVGEGYSPEIYRLDAHRLPLAMGRARRATAPGLMVTAPLATAVLAAGAPGLRGALDVALGVLALTAAVSALALWSAGRRVRRSWNAYELSLGARSLRVASRGAAPIEIRRDDLLAIRERRGGLALRTAQESACIPVDIEGYDDIRARLAGWRPIAPRRRGAGLWAPLALAFALGSCGVLALTAQAPTLAAAGLVFVVVAAALAIVDMILHPALSYRIKVAGILAAALPALYLMVGVLRRLG